MMYLVHALRWIPRLLLIVGGLLTLMVLGELARFYLFLRDLAPVLAAVYAVLLGAGLLALLVAWLRAVFRYPRVLKTPAAPATDAASSHRWVRYYERYLQRLAANPSLPEEQRRRATEGLAALQASVRAAGGDADRLREALAWTEKEAIRPALDHLGACAAREVRAGTRDVMLGVTLSPYHSVDLLVVLYRNTAMVLRVLRLYAARPAPRETWMILRDVLKVVATVNFFHLGRRLLENLFANIPFIGRAIDDIGQGLGAGFLTSAAGHAAVDRCAAFRGWDREEAARSLAGQVRTFGADVRDMFFKDVLPSLRSRIEQAAPESTASQPGFWERITRGINGALDTTTGAIDALVVRPVARAGGSVARVTGRGGRSVWRRVRGLFKRPA